MFLSSKVVGQMLAAGVQRQHNFKGIDKKDDSTSADVQGSNPFGAKESSAVGGTETKKKSRFQASML